MTERITITHLTLVPWRSSSFTGLCLICFHLGFFSLVKGSTASRRGQVIQSSARMTSTIRLVQLSVICHPVPPPPPPSHITLHFPAHMATHAAAVTDYFNPPLCTLRCTSIAGSFVSSSVIVSRMNSVCTSGVYQNPAAFGAFFCGNQ